MLFKSALTTIALAVFTNPHTAWATPVPEPIPALNITELIARQGQSGLEVTFFEHRGCAGFARDQFVRVGSCATPSPGFSSVRIREKKGQVLKVTVYTRGDCGCPTCGSHGYNPDAGQCLEFPEFVGNAIGVA